MTDLDKQLQDKLLEHKNCGEVDQFTECIKRMYIVLVDISLHKNCGASDVEETPIAYLQYKNVVHECRNCQFVSCFFLSFWLMFVFH
jgi:hypothetical protein